MSESYLSLSVAPISLSGSMGVILPVLSRQILGGVEDALLPVEEYCAIEGALHPVATYCALE